MDDDEKHSERLGHITSLSVLRTYRRQGLATRLMKATEFAMKTCYNADGVCLNVRVSNRAAIGLYEGVLGYKVFKEEVGYYADGENAYEMKKVFQDDQGTKHSIRKDFLKKIGKWNEEWEKEATEPAEEEVKKPQPKTEVPKEEKKAEEAKPSE